MPSPLENLAGPGKSLRAEPPDAKEFAGLKRSGLARLSDATNTGRFPGGPIRSRLQRSTRLVPRGIALPWLPPC